jgi:two-component system CheB/CheR fusion protein
MDAYAAMLEGNDQELDLLFKELLIGVTGFFRDTPVWEALKTEVLPRLLAERGPGHHLRAWVVGCSTGEEAYSLAMTYREVQESMAGRHTGSLQVFATDLSTDAIDAARRGNYPLAIAGELSTERLARFFTRQDEGYRIAKSIREMVCAPHDGGGPALHQAGPPELPQPADLPDRAGAEEADAAVPLQPEPRRHPAARQRRDLGASERLFELLDAVAPVSAREACWARPSPSSRCAWPGLDFEETRVPDDLLLDFAGRRRPRVLQSHAPAAVLVTDAGDIVYISGRTGRYLEPAAGKANWNIHVMARPAIRAHAALDW